MVQFFNFHIGAAETATAPKLNSGEAYIIWNQLASRYDCIEKTQIYLNLAHDPDLKVLLSKGFNILQNQTRELENTMARYELHLPCRPPKEINFKNNTEIFNDRLIFKDVLTGCENFLGYHLNAIRNFYTNDVLRKMFIKFLNVELQVFDDACKYGKMKGWLHIPPLYNA
ncbi:Protein of unknown function [Desulfotomaculum arcticum]|uniref:DUF3231 family protein n=1 Tax=Desulfotruncus arcticus DSM 17038 TaxID=1121424 RepID=A0A1I2U090_9FIRM|nr:DUF3231 family protein [Desulfotruncus arcticus]SFG70565.1 Protein of unknown function [Desulfotomaculum arcticum] [Desulfotruncus arcticus DSM 17038]